MKRRFAIVVSLIMFVSICAGVGIPQQPKAVVPPVNTIKMPAERAKQLKELQTQADKIKAEFDTAMREIQLRANAVVTRAALEAGLTAAQLDSMDLGLDGEGNYEWRPKPPKAPESKPQPKE